MTQIFNNRNKKKEANNSLLLLPSAAIFLFISGASQACRGGTIRELRVKRGNDWKHNGGLITSPPGQTAESTPKIRYDYLLWAKVTGNGAWAASCGGAHASQLSQLHTFWTCKGPCLPPPPPVKRGAGVLLHVSSPLQCSVEGLKKIKNKTTCVVFK